MSLNFFVTYVLDTYKRRIGQTFLGPPLEVVVLDNNKLHSLRYKPQLNKKKAGGNSLRPMLTFYFFTTYAA